MEKTNKFNNKPKRLGSSKRFKVRTKKKGTTSKSPNSATVNPKCKPKNSGGIDYGSTLLACTTVEQVQAWLAERDRDFKEKSLGAIAKRKIPDKTKVGIQSLLSEPFATSVFTLNNEKLAQLAFETLHEGLKAAAEADENIEFGFVTIIDGRGGTSLARPTIDLFDAKKRASKVLAKLAPNWIAVSELAFFNNKPHELGGRHLQRHEHALIWGPQILTKAAASIASLQDRFLPNITEAKAIQLQPVERDEVNLARMAAYLMKAPDKGKTWCPPKEGSKGHMHHSAKSDRLINFARLAMIRSMLTFEDVCFASKEGQEIRRRIVKLTRATVQTDAANRRIFHPDEIPSFWADVAMKLKRPAWALPIVKKSE